MAQIIFPGYKGIFYVWEGKECLRVNYFIFAYGISHFNYNCNIKKKHWNLLPIKGIYNEDGIYAFSLLTATCFQYKEVERCVNRS